MKLKDIKLHLKKVIQFLIKLEFIEDQIVLTYLDKERKRLGLFTLRQSVNSFKLFLLMISIFLMLIWVIGFSFFLTEISFRSFFVNLLPAIFGIFLAAIIIEFTKRDFFYLSGLIKYYSDSITKSNNLIGKKEIAWETIDVVESYFSKTAEEKIVIPFIEFYLISQEDYSLEIMDSFYSKLSSIIKNNSFEKVKYLVYETYSKLQSEKNSQINDEFLSAFIDKKEVKLFSKLLSLYERQKQQGLRYKFMKSLPQIIDSIPKLSWLFILILIVLGLMFPERFSEVVSLLPFISVNG